MKAEDWLGGYNSNSSKVDDSTWIRVEAMETEKWAN